MKTNLEEYKGREGIHFYKDMKKKKDFFFIHISILNIDPFEFIIFSWYSFYADIQVDDHVLSPSIKLLYFFKGWIKLDFCGRDITNFKKY